MIFDRDSGLHLPAPDHDRPHRLELLNELGLNAPASELDAFATDLADKAGTPYAMVNVFTDRQNFVGLCSPSGDGDLPAVDRSMPLDHGFCPEVFALRIARILPDVFANPRWASNPVVDKIGVRTYAGAPLIHQPTGITLGTLCWVGTEPRPLSTGKASERLIKQSRDELMTFISRRASVPSK